MRTWILAAGVLLIQSLALSPAHARQEPSEPNDSRGPVGNLDLLMMNPHENVKGPFKANEVKISKREDYSGITISYWDITRSKWRVYGTDLLDAPGYTVNVLHSRNIELDDAENTIWLWKDETIGANKRYFGKMRIGGSDPRLQN